MDHVRGRCRRRVRARRSSSISTRSSPRSACPHLPENTSTVSTRWRGIKIDQVVIGSCTNGRIEDMEAAYEILKGKHSRQGRALHHHPRHAWPIYKECILRGATPRPFIDAGCIVSTPTCGPCLGGYMGILADGRALLSPPPTATSSAAWATWSPRSTSPALPRPAASALTGYITDPREV